MRGYGVYRLYDRGGRLLYIGKASDGPDGRVAEHRKRLWGRRIYRVHWTPYPTEAAALEAERAAIRREAPRYNQQHNLGRYFPDHLLPPLGDRPGGPWRAWQPIAALALVAAGVWVLLVAL